MTDPGETAHDQPKARGRRDTDAGSSAELQQSLGTEDAHNVYYVKFFMSLIKLELLAMGAGRPNNPPARRESL
jgi:hypothetical protein